MIFQPQYLIENNEYYFFGGDINQMNRRKDKKSPLHKLIFNFDNENLISATIGQVFHKDLGERAFTGVPQFSQNLPNKKNIGNQWIFIDSTGIAHKFDELTMEISNDDLKKK